MILTYDKNDNYWSTVVVTHKVTFANSYRDFLLIYLKIKWNCLKSDINGCLKSKGLTFKILCLVDWIE